MLGMVSMWNMVNRAKSLKRSKERLKSDRFRIRRYRETNKEGEAKLLILHFTDILHMCIINVNCVHAKQANNRRYIYIWHNYTIPTTYLCSPCEDGFPLCLFAQPASFWGLCTSQLVNSIIIIHGNSLPSTSLLLLNFWLFGISALKI